MASDIVSISQQQQAQNRWARSATPGESAQGVNPVHSPHAAHNSERVGPAYLLSLSKEAQEYLKARRAERGE